MLMHRICLRYSDDFSGEADLSDLAGRGIFGSWLDRLAKCPLPTGIPGLETPRKTLMDRRGNGVRVILENSEKLSGKRPVYEMFGDELRLTIYAADPATGSRQNRPLE